MKISIHRAQSDGKKKKVFRTRERDVRTRVRDGAGNRRTNVVLTKIFTAEQAQQREKREQYFFLLFSYRRKHQVTKRQGTISTLTTNQAEMYQGEFGVKPRCKMKGVGIWTMPYMLHTREEKEKGEGVTFVLVSTCEESHEEKAHHVQLYNGLYQMFLELLTGV